jgi:hypothetical protein
MKNKEKLRCRFEKLYGRVQESREIKRKKKKNRNGYQSQIEALFSTCTISIWRRHQDDSNDALE